MIDAIISVHVPKAAGTSFLHQLKEAFGEQQVLMDYNDDPANPQSIVNIDPNCYEFDPIKTISPYKVVHGHFQPKKYEKISNAFRLTFLRHPVNNIASIYYFWMAHERNFWNSPIFHYVKDRNLTLLQFASLPAMRHLYTHTYFGNYDMSHFNFIGDFEKYEAELLRLGGRLGVSFKSGVRLNVTSEYTASKGILQSEKPSTDDAEFARLAEILKDDIEFYQAFKGK